MSTNQEQLRNLRRQVKSLATQIETSGREDECKKLIDEARNNPDNLQEITDEEWSSFLPIEKEQSLPRYYCSLRIRLRELEMRIRDNAQQEGGAEEFLQRPYVRAAITVAEIGVFLEFLAHLAHAAGHAAGLFAVDDPADG
jgi:hypothetical protein